MEELNLAIEPELKIKQIENEANNKIKKAEEEFRIKAKQLDEQRKQLEEDVKIKIIEADERAKKVSDEAKLKAKQLEEARDEAKKRSPWIGYASTAYQLSIVLLSASILAVSMPLFWGSLVVAGIGVLLSSQGVLLWF